MVYTALLSELAFLSLNGTQVTSDGLDRLKGLNKLDLLYVAGTRADTTELEKALPACCVVPSTQLMDGTAMHSISVQRLAERMLMLCGASGVDRAFLSQRATLEAFLSRLRRRPRSDVASRDSLYSELIRIIEPRDLSMQLRLSAAYLEWADHSIASVIDLEQRKQRYGLTTAEAKQHADQLKREELLLDGAAERLGLRALMTPKQWRSVIAGLCEQTRPNSAAALAPSDQGPELIAPTEAPRRLSKRNSRANEESRFLNRQRALKTSH